MTLTPDEARELGNIYSVERIPKWVTDVVDEILIEQDAGNSSARIYQKDVVKRLVATGNVADSKELFDKKLLDFEPVYREAGWSVNYDKPAYCESYEPYWVFTPKDKRGPRY